TPFTRTRDIRSAAPTPDTAAIGRKFSFSFAGNNNFSHDDDIEEGYEDEDDQWQNANMEPLGVKEVKEGEEEEETEFAKWFWENRGDSNPIQLIVGAYLSACDNQLPALQSQHTFLAKMGYKRKTDPAVALEVERKLALAVAYYKSHQKSFFVVANHFGVSRNTLYRRVKGTHRSYAESHAASQRLSTSAEAALEQRIHEACDGGFPPTLKQVKEWAQKLVDDDYEKAKKEGKVPRFSHADKLDDDVGGVRGEHDDAGHNDSDNDDHYDANDEYGNDR
ncbi:hypothetical protein KCU62_g6177, partial [Aureobasidium sp. EXF-3399]